MGSIDVKPDPWQRLVAIGSILSVLLVAVGLYVTNEANREQQRLTAQGQITDRFAKAVEQLGQPGPEKVDVRLGAIYSLERIMRDSADDQSAIVDVLAAFVRVHAPAPQLSTRPSPSAGPATPAGSGADRPPADIQAALTVLIRRDTAQDGRKRLDLRRTDLSGADLVEADLSGANLTGALLIRTDLTDADLAGANLVGANLDDASLSRTNLAGADLAHAGANDVRLIEANLARANLLGTQLTFAKLREADLTDAHLYEANLADADLRDADLTDASLDRANLTRASLANADLTRANLTGADLTFAELTGANLTGANLTCVKTDERTQWPAGVARSKPCG